MNSPQIQRTRRRLQAVGWVFSAIILTLGIWLTIATGEWIALLLALGLVIIPVGTVKSRARNAQLVASEPPVTTSPIPTLR
jgi:dipeptide/tripeptide permease